MPCSHSLHIPTADSFLASHRSSTGVVFRGVYPTHHDRYTVPFNRGRLFHIPVCKDVPCLTIDKQFRHSVRLDRGTFAVTFRVPKRSVNITTDALRAPSTGVTCT